MVTGIAVVLYPKFPDGEILPLAAPVATKALTTPAQAIPCMMNNMTSAKPKFLNIITSLVIEILDTAASLQAYFAAGTKFLLILHNVYQHYTPRVYEYII